MIPSRVLTETIARYRQRQPLREEKKRKVEAGDILAADSPERVGRRLNRLARGGTATESELAVALERVLGTNDLVGVQYLDQALRASRTVGRVRVRSSTGQVLMNGTGFLVSPRLLLTNHHVLVDSAAAAYSQVELNYQDGIDGKPLVPVVFDLQPERFFLTDEALDYSLVAVSERARDTNAPLDFGWNSLVEEQGKVIVGEWVNIVQHPNGERKQLALRENQVVDILDTFLHYETDTAPGSSGAPVYNDQWEVVALHHSGVPRRNAQGRILTRDGRIWTEDMGEQEIDWISNEGVRISLVVKHIKAQSLSGEQAGLRAEMFAAQPATSITPETGQPLLRRSSPGAAGSGGLGPRVGADGSAVWTLPIEISVRVGQAGTPVEPAARTPSVSSPVQPVADGDDAPVPDSAELRDALRQLREAETQPYYDEASDALDRDAYYAGLDLTGNPNELYDVLHEHLESTHFPRLTYKPAVHVYPVVDIHSDGLLRSIYSGSQIDPTEAIRADFLVEAQRERLRERLRSNADGRELLAAEAALLEADLPFNCEHVVPQSYFAKQEPMKGDLHHLFACEPDCNSFRGNIPYFDFPDFMETDRSECGRRDENRFEPEGGKGAVARATLYFLLRYPGQINATANEYTPDRLPTLIKWHQEHPVTRYERHRNARIRGKQGNRNPLIDFPELAEQINFERGLG